MDQKWRLDDVVPFIPHEHDVRVVRDGWVFYVRGVKVGEPFVGDVTWDGSLVGLVLTPLVKIAFWLLRRPVRTWKIGVLRYRGGWRGGRIRVVYKETISAGERPERRIGELLDDINAGRFD